MLRPELKQREDYFIASRYFITDPEVIELKRRLWQRSADLIENALGGCWQQ